MSHQNRRDPLPEEYQFGDAKHEPIPTGRCLAKHPLRDIRCTEPAYHTTWHRGPGPDGRMVGWDAPIEPNFIYESARPCGCDPAERHVAEQCRKGCISIPAEGLDKGWFERSVARAAEDVKALPEWLRTPEPHNDYSTPPIGDISLAGGVPQRLNGAFFNCGCKRYIDRHGIETIQRCTDGQCQRLGRR